MIYDEYEYAAMLHNDLTNTHGIEYLLITPDDTGEWPEIFAAVRELEHERESDVIQPCSPHGKPDPRPGDKVPAVRDRAD